MTFIKEDAQTTVIWMLKVKLSLVYYGVSLAPSIQMNSTDSTSKKSYICTYWPVCAPYNECTVYIFEMQPMAWVGEKQ